MSVLIFLSWQMEKLRPGKVKRDQSQGDPDSKCEGYDEVVWERLPFRKGTVLLRSGMTVP